MTDRVQMRFIPWMKRRGVKPNPNIETVLHRRPVAGMIDGILLNELRQITDLKEFAAAERVALQVSWHLHAVIAQKIPRI